MVVSFPRDGSPKNNAKVAWPARPEPESGIFVVMHHNDNWSPQIRDIRRRLMRATVAALSVASVVLTIAWISLLIYLVQAAAVSTVPLLTTIASDASHFLRWVWSWT